VGGFTTGSRKVPGERKPVIRDDDENIQSYNFLLYTVIKFQISWKVEDLLTISATISFLGSPVVTGE
jgi:hypothetical protein